MIRVALLLLGLTFGAEGCVQVKDSDRVDMLEPGGAVLIAPESVSEPGNAGGTPGLVDLPRYPSISPDGTQIVFSWRGDLWKVAAGGGGSPAE